jgi:uncharacterized damage-inducible protein DinB
MNNLLIDAISDHGMSISLSNKGGRTIFQQWIHIHNIRLQWLEVTAKDLTSNLEKLDKDLPFDRLKIIQALEDSAKGIHLLLDRSWENNGKVKGFKKGVIPFLGYFISHESHHRGNIILTLKQSGEKLPDTVKWGLWEWDR